MLPNVTNEKIVKLFYEKTQKNYGNTNWCGLCYCRLYNDNDILHYYMGWEVKLTNEMLLSLF